MELCPVLGESHFILFDTERNLTSLTGQVSFQSAPSRSAPSIEQRAVDGARPRGEPTAAFR